MMTSEQAAEFVRLKQQNVKLEARVRELEKSINMMHGQSVHELAQLALKYLRGRDAALEKLKEFEEYTTKIGLRKLIEAKYTLKAELTTALRKLEVMKKAWRMDPGDESLHTIWKQANDIIKEPAPKEERKRK